MFVDPVSSDYDLDRIEEPRDVVFKYNDRNIKQLDESFSYGKALNFPREILQLSSQRKINPMMSGCSASYKQNADGSWEAVIDVRFTNEKEIEATREGEKSNNENSVGQGPSFDDTDRPDSRDRDKH